MDTMRKMARLAVVTALSLCLFSGDAAAAPLLKLNAHGHDVIVLQQLLQQLNYKITAADGVFGRETEKAVLEFQRDQKMKITGIVDRQTWQAIKSAHPGQKTGTDLAPAVKPQPAAKSVPESTPFLSRDKVQPLLATARKYIGAPYRFGGTTPKAFDCSGYVQYVFAQNQVTLPRTADEQYKLGKLVSAQKLEAGDLVFFTTYDAGASHCGIYIGDGKFIHTSSSKGVRIDRLDDDYWRPHYLGGKHIVK